MSGDATGPACGGRARIVFRASRTTTTQTIVAAEGCTLSVQAYEYPPSDDGGRAVWITEQDGDGNRRRSWWRACTHMVDIT